MQSPAAASDTTPNEYGNDILLGDTGTYVHAVGALTETRVVTANAKEVPSTDGRPNASESEVSASESANVTGDAYRPPHHRHKRGHHPRALPRHRRPHHRRHRSHSSLMQSPGTAGNEGDLPSSRSSLFEDSRKAPWGRRLYRGWPRPNPTSVYRWGSRARQVRTLQLLDYIVSKLNQTKEDNGSAEKTATDSETEDSDKDKNTDGNEEEDEGKKASDSESETSSILQAIASAVDGSVATRRTGKGRWAGFNNLDTEEIEDGFRFNEELSGMDSSFTDESTRQGKGRSDMAADYGVPLDAMVEQDPEEDGSLNEGLRDDPQAGGSGKVKGKGKLKGSFGKGFDPISMGTTDQRQVPLGSGDGGNWGGKSKGKGKMKGGLLGDASNYLFDPNFPSLMDSAETRQGEDGKGKGKAKRKGNFPSKDLNDASAATFADTAELRQNPQGGDGGSKGKGKGKMKGASLMQEMEEKEALFETRLQNIVQKFGKRRVAMAVAKAGLQQIKHMDFDVPSDDIKPILSELFKQYTL